jgi:hypothetical protein
VSGTIPATLILNRTMKKVLVTVGAVLLNIISLSSFAQSEETIFSGKNLFADVKKYVAFGDHRTATTADYQTSAWLEEVLSENGFQTSFFEFPVKQFFPEKTTFTIDNKDYEVFPLWPVLEKENLGAHGILIDADGLKDKTKLKGKLALTRLPAPGGQTTEQTYEQLQPLIEAGAVGIVAITESTTGELVAYNTLASIGPWEVPVVQIAPVHSTALKKAAQKKRTGTIQIEGTFKDVQARNVYGTIGNGNQYVVISTPISGWFACGGERGPGIAIWNALAAWLKEHHKEYPYTFLFTANSGHELNNLGAEVFLEKQAPKPEQTRLWVHLGAAIATRAWKEDNGLYYLTDEPDENRNIFYTPSIAQNFEKIFNPVKARKVLCNAENKNVISRIGETGVVIAHDYPNVLGFAYLHRYHHIASDDERFTSPGLLEAIGLSIRNFIQTELHNQK